LLDIGIVLYPSSIFQPEIYLYSLGIRAYVEKGPLIEIYFQQTSYRVKSRMIFHDSISI